MDILRNIAIFLGSLFFLFLLVTNSIHFHTQISDQQKIFLKGKVPESLPDGLYKGTFNQKEIFWRGKKFNREQHTGINIFKEGDHDREAYPFKTYVGKGSADRELTVIKIDYNLPENPLWLRPALDEIVEIEPDHYLGKIHVRILPGISVAIGYFELRK